MTIKEIYKKYPSLLALDLDLLLSYAINKSKEFLFAHPEYSLSLWQTIQFNYFLYRYQRGLPLAYITHHKEFFGLNFLVNKHTLIPRPDTEIMVEEVIKIIEQQKIQDTKSRIILIDVGTGSGCIPISILKKFIPEDIETFAVDISRPALRVARKNAQLHKVKINFLHSNLLEKILQQFKNLTKKQATNIIITANLPYLTSEQFKNEPSIQHEPYSALVADDQGLELYKKLLQQIKNFLPHLIHLQTFFEIDPSQTSTITSEIKKSLPTADIKVIPDLARRDRVIYFQILS